ELRQGFRRAPYARLLVLVLAIDDGAHAGVIGNAIQLAVVRGRALQAAKPRLVVGERRLRQLLERTGSPVLRHLAITELDDIRRVSAGEGGVELRQMGAPRLVLDVDVDVRVLRFEIPVGEGNSLRPT